MKNWTLFITLFFFTMTTWAQEFKLLPEKTTITWTGKAALSSYSPTGTLEASEGLITIEGDTITALDVTIDMRTLYQENKRLMNHLKGKDFFHVKKYGTARFVFSENAALENGNTIVKGNLTIKDQTHAEEISATLIIKETSVTLAVDTVLDRTRYGIKYNSPSFFKSLKENAIADDFRLKGTLTFALKKD